MRNDSVLAGFPVAGKERGVKRICLFCRESFFHDFDRFGANRGLKCGPANMKVCSQTEGLECFREDSPERIKEKGIEYAQVFGKKNQDSD